MKLIVAILIPVAVALLIYLGTAFLYLDFNLSTFSQEDRSTMLILWIIFSTTIDFVVMFWFVVVYDDDKDRHYS